MADQQMCMACEKRPAVTKGSTPLCARCAALAKGNERGVKFEKGEESSPNTLRTGESPTST
jgi:hypothetical protein